MLKNQNLIVKSSSPETLSALSFQHSELEMNTTLIDLKKSFMLGQDS